MATQHISESPKADAQYMIEGFHAQFGDAHFSFACLAAFPVSLTPRLLYTMRDYYAFRPDEHHSLPFPWEAVSDLLLSPLCKHVRGERYEMEPHVRKFLLKELQEDELMGEALIQSLSDFLQDEIHQMANSSNPNEQAWAQNQAWSIQVYREPEQVLKEMASRLPASEENLQKDRAYLQIRQLTDVMRIQAGEAAGEFEKLHLVTDRMASYANGQTQKLDLQSLGKLLDDKGQLVLGGIEVFVPAKDIPAVEDPVAFQAEVGLEIARERIQRAMESGKNELHLDNLNLTRIPEDVGELYELEVLDLSNNQLDHIPEELELLKQLTSLNLSSNKLTSLDMGDMDPSFLWELQSLDLSENQLKEVNISLEASQLKILNLNGNQLSELPIELGSLYELRQLHIERNQFTQIPDVVIELEKLELLDISHNQLEEISKNISYLNQLLTLDLGYNRIKSLTNELLQLSNLIHLDLTGNPIEYPPKSVWRQGLGPIRKYLKNEGRLTAPPLIFLAFAQVDDPNAHLATLEKEKKSILAGLQLAIAHGLCEVVVRDVSNLKEIEEVFADPAYINRMAIFHYAGHINEKGFFLKEEDVSRESVISLFQHQQSVQVVFLNSDNTQSWLKDLFEAGIPYVVATEQPIQDELATEFAAKFYQYLGYDIGIKQALDKANAAIQERFNQFNPRTR